MDRQRLGVRGVPRGYAPISGRVGSVLAASPRHSWSEAPSRSAQLAHRPLAHLEPLRQVQAAAHRGLSSEGRAAHCSSAAGQARLGAMGVTLHPSGATPGHAAVPSPRGAHPLAIGLGCHTSAGVQDWLGSRARAGATGMLCQPPCPASSHSLPWVSPAQRM